MGYKNETICPVCNKEIKNIEFYANGDSRQISRFICPYCGKKLILEIMFCPGCGKRLFIVIVDYTYHSIKIEENKKNS
jgi:predicted amidophosphoribosyltransferase